MRHKVYMNVNEKQSFSGRIAILTETESYVRAYRKRDNLSHWRRNRMRHI